MRLPHPLRVLGLGLILLACSQTAILADLVPLTGDATIDLPSSNPNIFIISDRTDDVAQSAWVTNRGWTSGWNIQDLRIGYDSNTDTLTVGINFIGIAGDADGNGDPNSADPMTTASGGLDIAHLGGRESITVAFAKIAPNGLMGDKLIVAGVPADKSRAGSGIDGFTVASFAEKGGLAYSYGQSMAGDVGQLAFDPSAAHPDFVFTIKNVTPMGLSPLTGFFVSAFAGSPDDVVSGEDTIGWTKVSGFKPVPQVVPEPSSLVLLGVGGAVGLLGLRGRRRATVK